ncbi:MAG: hypothetical protein ACREQ1_16685, partial [Woeseiaceae bacterium]
DKELDGLKLDTRGMLHLSHDPDGSVHARSAEWGSDANRDLRGRGFLREARWMAEEGRSRQKHEQ